MIEWLLELRQRMQNRTLYWQLEYLRCRVAKTTARSLMTVALLCLAPLAAQAQGLMLRGVGGGAAAVSSSCINGTSAPWCLLGIAAAGGNGSTTVTVPASGCTTSSNSNACAGVCTASGCDATNANLIVVAAHNGSSTNVSDNQSNSYTSPSATTYCRLWYLLTPFTSATTMTFTDNQTNTPILVELWKGSGGSGNGSFDVFHGTDAGSSVTTLSTGNLVMTGSGELVFTAMVIDTEVSTDNGAVLNSPGVLDASMHAGTFIFGAADGYAVNQTGTQSYTWSWTTATSSGGVCAEAFLPHS